MTYIARNSSHSPAYITTSPAIRLDHTRAGHAEACHEYCLGAVANDTTQFDSDCDGVLCGSLPWPETRVRSSTGGTAGVTCDPGPRPETGG